MATNNSYYIYGDEDYLVDQEIKNKIAIAQQSGEEIEVQYLDIDELSAYELGEALEFSPLFSLGRVLIIKNPAWLLKSVRRPKKAEEVLAVLEDYFSREHQGQTLVFTSRELASTNAITKRLQKWMEVIQIKKPTPVFLENWMKEQCHRVGVEFAAPALKTAANSGQDMYYLKQMIEKMSLLHLNKPVGVRELEEEIDSRQEVKIFKLTDALLSKNIKTSVEAFNQLQQQGMHHLLMLTMISRQFITLAKVKHYHDQSLPRQQIESLTGQKEFTVKKLTEKSSNFSWENIRELFRIFLKMDVSFKSEAKDPRILMESLLIKICSMSG